MNTNSLADCCCPSCDSDGPFQVVACSVFTVFDHGTDGHGDVEYDHASPAYCVQCDWSGVWGDLSSSNKPTTSSTKDT